MAEYQSLAPLYNILTGNVDYGEIHCFYLNIFNALGHTPRLLLDLACGTGTLSFAFEKDGFDVIGTDSSDDMLAEAMERKFDYNSNVMFLNQKARELDLYGTVDTVVCNLDAVNHFCPEDMEEIFRRISLFTEVDGLLVFDVNSEYKFTNLLNDACYFYDEGDVFCCWSSSFDGVKAEIHMDIFERTHKSNYVRGEENITEYFYSDEYLTSLLNKFGFELVFRGSDYSALSPDEKCERIHYIARKRDD